MGSAFLQFWCNIIHCKYAYKNGLPLLFMFLVCLSMFDMSHFYKNANLEDILCYLVEICVLSEIHASNARFKQIIEKICSSV